jgi:hypothetical protein
MYPFPRLTWVLSLLGALALGVAVTWMLMPRREANQPAPAPIISLEKMGQLVSVKVNYADIVEFTENRSFDIPWSQWELQLGGTKVLLVARGDCTVATNLSAARYERIDAKARTLTVVLPLPRPLQARINHASRENGGSYFYAITNLGLEPIIPDSTNRTQAINHALTWAQKDVERVCSRPAIQATAKQNAENVLRATYLATGWTPTFVWK